MVSQKHFKVFILKKR